MLGLVVTMTKPWRPAVALSVRAPRDSGSPMGHTARRRAATMVAMVRALIVWALAGFALLAQAFPALRRQTVPVRSAH